MADRARTSATASDAVRSHARHRRRGPDADGPAARARSRTSPAPTSAASRSAARWRRPAWRREQVEYVIMGQVLHGRRRADPGPAGRGRGRHPDDRARADDQQGLPVRPRRHRAGRPAHPRRRVRRRRRRWPGVDDEGAAPAAEARATGYKYGDVTVRDHMAYDGLWDVFTDQRDGRADRAAQRRRRQFTREEQDEFAARSHQLAAAGAGRTASSTTRWCRWRSRSARATRSCSPRTRASAPTPPPSRWPGSSRRSARTARSPPVRPRRSPTAPPRSS